MIITVVSDVLGKENNGTTIAGMNLIRFLKKQGHEVRILCADQDKKGEPRYYVVPVKSYGKVLDKLVKKVGVTLAKPQQNVVEEALKGADHAHIMLPFKLGKSALAVAMKEGISTTAGFHMQAENFTSYFKLNKIKVANKMVYKYIYKNFYKNVGGIHYPTQFIRDVFENNINRSTPGYVISNGVHNYVQMRGGGQRKKPSAYLDRIVILSTGRLAREKSQDTLLKAVKYSKYKDKIQIILAGLGLKEKHYKKLGKKLPIEPIMGFFGRNEIIDILNYSDLYVHPAEIELEGIACLEAVTCGKLTIVSDSKKSATRNFAIDDKCRFKNRNPKDLARVIDYWIEHPQEKKKYELKYLKSAISYNQEECMKKMEEMIFEVHNQNK